MNWLVCLLKTKLQMLTYTLDFLLLKDWNLIVYYDIILEKNVDFLIIDFHLEKQVTYKGIDVLREIRKHDSTIYAVLLTNYELDDFADQFGDYDYELQKSEITSRYKDVAEKIKRACGLRKENLMYRAVEIKQQQDTETIRLLQEISSKLDEKK